MDIKGYLLVKLTALYCRWHDWYLRRWFLRNARKYKYVTPERGVTIIGSLETRGSLSKVLRDLARKLQQVQIPFQTFSTSPRRMVAEEEVASILTPRKQFRAGKYALVIEMFDSVFPAEKLGLCRATIVFWEFSSALFTAHKYLKKKSLLIGMSNFNADYFASIISNQARAHKLLYPFQPSKTKCVNHPEICAKFGLKNDDFVIFFNFDYGSSFGRKNPDGAIRAFAKAFHNEESAKLVFKTQNAKAFPNSVARIQKLVKELGLDHRFISIDHYISEMELYGLTNTCDVYLSLHRGEGFGLGIAEAMSLGKPVVVTNYSSTTEFCNAQNSLPIPYKLIPPSSDQIDHPFLKDITSWAEPDIDAAAKALRLLYENPELRKKLGAAAQAFIAEHFSIENFRKSVNALLDDVGAN